MVRLALVLVVLSGLAIIGCDSALLTLPGPGSPTPMPEPRYDGSGDVRLIDMTSRRELSARYAETGAEIGYNVTQGTFDRDNDGEIDDRDAFRRAMRGLVPHGFRGVVSLDWEGTMYKWLKTNPAGSTFKRGMENYSELLAIARSERPEAQFGVYGLPSREYWKRDANWRTQSKALVPLLSQMDWIGPSLYHLYETPRQRPHAEYDAFVRENITMALEVAQLAGNKPVYAYVYHRYVPSNKDRPNHLVDEQSFKRNLNTILTTTVNGRSTAGIVWWAAESWYHKRGDIPEPAGSDPEAYFTKLHNEYLTRITDVIR